MFNYCKKTKSRNANEIKNNSTYGRKEMTRGGEWQRVPALRYISKL